MAIYWEWEIATLDQNGDTVDLDHCDGAAIIRFFPTAASTVISLVRRAGNDRDGETDRSYAECTGNMLPAATEGGHKIPAKYRNYLPT